MKLNRREILRLASTGLALPWLSNIGRAQQSDRSSPKRVFIFIDPYGRFGEQTTSPVTDDAPWITDESKDYALNPQNLGWMLKPLEKHIHNLSVFSGIYMRSRVRLGGGISHAQVNSYALTGSRVSGNIRSNATVCAHPSLNNYIGDELNAAALTKSIYNSLSMGNVGQYNYGSDGLRAGAFGNPEAIYNTAFGVSDTRGLTAQQAVVKQVQQQISQIAPQLVQANAATVIDAYRSSVDAIATELELRGVGSCEDRTPDNVRDSGAGQQGIAQMFNAIYDLFSCGLTPSILLGHSHTGSHGWLQNTDIVDSTGNSFVSRRNHHNLSHQNNEDAGAAQGLVMRGQIAEMSRLADRLSETPELDGSGDTMMDNTVMFYHQSMCRNTHGTRTPYYHFFLAGANTNVNRGMHFDCSEYSDNELFTTLAQSVGIPATQFGGFNAMQYRGETLNRGPISQALVQTLGA